MFVKNHYGKEEWFTAVVDEMDLERDKSDGKIHHVLYVSDGKEECIDLNKEDWRLLPKNWQDKEKKFLTSRGKVSNSSFMKFGVQKTSLPSSFALGLRQFNCQLKIFASQF